MSDVTVPQPAATDNRFPEGPLFHASYQGVLSGVGLDFGDSVLFAPVDDAQLYPVEPACILRQGLLADDAAERVRATILDPRWQRLGGRVA